MDAWPRMGRLERDLTLIAVGVLAVASTAGAIVGCVGYHVLSRVIGGGGDAE